nr:protein FAR1-RELATED SEQUENCE 5-like [Aegilops tauschii subsp. strangulata]
MQRWSKHEFDIGNDQGSHDMEIHPPPINLDNFSKTFESIEAVEKFYKAYAHSVGFSVRIGQKRTDGKYCISYFQEEHTHEFVTPSKQHLTKSNREVSEKAKTTLFTCHAASIGTSGAFRLLRVGEGGFQFVGCTKRDLQNYHRDMRSSFEDTDAQMFIDNLRKRKKINPGFFFDYVLDDKNPLTRVFWADAFCRKNYALFGEMVSFDSTYSTNQYKMIFCPFTGIHHHMGSVFYGAALIVDEKIKSYKWVFETFLKAMDGVAPRLIVTDEDASMKAALDEVMPNTVHRLCMWTE